LSTNAQKTILIVDDEPEIGIALTNYLTYEGFLVEVAANGAEMETALTNSQIDLILLDLGLPNESGLDLLKDVVAKNKVAIVILTGKSDPIERVVGLELGADDYIVKPFMQRELLARINAVLRRTYSRNDVPNNALDAAPKKIRVNNLLMDMQKRQVQTDDGTQIDLTGIEFNLLVTLAKNAGETLSRNQLSRSTLNREWYPTDRSVDIHVHNLRRKLSRNNSKEEVIFTIRNVGYVLAAEVVSQ